MATRGAKLFQTHERLRRSTLALDGILRSDPDSLATAGRSLVRISNFLTVGVAIILILIFSAAEWRKLYIPRYGANK